MGIIQKQSIKGTLYSYMGVAIGFVTTGLLFPRFLSTDEIGLLKLLVSFSVLISQFGSLGFHGVTARLFPYFRSKENNHKGFLFLALAVSIIGFFISLGLFEFLKPMLIRNNAENSSLLVKYINYLIPLIFFTIFFNLFDSYNKAIYDAVLGAFIKEFVQRILILISLILYMFNFVEAHSFVKLYVLSMSAPALIIAATIIIRGEFSLKIPKKDFLTKKMVKEMLKLCLFSLISGFGATAIVNIDSILVNKFVGLSATGIYATNYFFAALVIIPSRSLLKISTTLIADAWKENNLSNIHLIYKKSVINQGLIALLIFGGLWLNIENIYNILPEEYSSGKWVIFFISLANVLAMSSGVAGTIIITSKHYKIHTIFILIFLSLIVGLGFLLIPIYGISGAALAFAISTLVFNLLRSTYVYFKFNMNPYDLKFFLLIIIISFSYYIPNLIPEFKNLIMDISVRSSLMLILFTLLIYFAQISMDVNNIIDKVLKAFGILSDKS